MDHYFGIFAVYCTALFTGAAFYITLVEHPARLECGSAVALRQFAPSYRRAAVMQASLAVLGTLFGLAAWWLSGLRSYAVGALLLGAVVPFTLVVIYPTNARLLSPELDPVSPLAESLLRQWGRLHAVRTALSTTALGLLLLAAVAGRTS